MAAGDITDALVEELAIRLEDEEEKEFSAETKIKMLDKAQLEILNMLHDAYLTELQNVTTGIDVEAGWATFDNIDSGGILRGAEGILKVKVWPEGGTDSYWAIEIDLKDIKKTENSYQAYSDTRPMYYVFGEKVYILCEHYTSTEADVYYLEKPPTLSTDVDPLLNTSLHHLMLDLAEAKCWAMNRQFDRRQSVMEFVLTQIEMLNARYTEAEGIGTQIRYGKEGAK